MILSKIILNIRHPSVRQALRDANDMHRNIMAGFSVQGGEEMARAELRVLYRLFSKRDQVYLLVSSDERPNTAALAERGFYTDEALIRDVTPLRDVFQAGRCLRFELFASPCRKVGGAGRNSRRMFLETPDERAEWLTRKGENGGFHILQLDELGGRVDVVGRRDSTVIKNSAVLYSGVLRITDADAFWHSYSEGIGPGKAYGMGMLNVSAAVRRE
ncbi:MAG: type I-E CRISPR-associated protein Cas6/Cse3/CasE [bacterium]